MSFTSQFEQAVRKLSLTSLGKLEGFGLGVRHLRTGRPSYYWVDAVIRPWIRTSSPGLPTHRLIDATFDRAAEAGEVWNCLQEKSAERGLRGPTLDEQLWFGSALDSEAELSRRLAEACQTFESKLIRVYIYDNYDDRGHGQWTGLRAEFAGRAGSGRNALVLGGEVRDRGEVQTWIDRLHV